jgi:molecular chaperone GrpE
MVKRIEITDQEPQPEAAATAAPQDPGAQSHEELVEAPPQEPAPPEPAAQAAVPEPPAGEEGEAEGEEGTTRVRDRRFWKAGAEERKRKAAEVKEPPEVERLKKALEEKDELLQKYIRAYKQAEQEFDRVRQRLEADLERRVGSERGRMAGSFFEVLDNLERSIESARKAQQFQPLLDGIEMVLRTFQGRMEGLGVTRYDPAGEPFDPTFHEAMGVLPVPEPERDNTVVHVYQAGYRAGEQVLRPARVMVGKAG